MPLQTKTISIFFLKTFYSDECEKHETQGHRCYNIYLSVFVCVCVCVCMGLCKCCIKGLVVYNFLLFPKLKKIFSRLRYEVEEFEKYIAAKIISAAKYEFERCFNLWNTHWNKEVEFQKDYVEDEVSFIFRSHYLLNISRLYRRVGQ